jgi:hypothetical protein
MKFLRNNSGNQPYLEASMKKLIIVLTLLIGSLSSALNAQATPSLSWGVTDLGSGNWQYSYTITNDLSDKAIDSFSIDFAYGLYDVLQVDSTPAGWGNSYAYNPDYTSTGPSNGAFWGFADAGSEIAAGTSLTGFLISFAWLPDPADAAYFTPLSNLITTTGDQAFTYTTIDLNPAPVPEPSTLLLLGAGFAGLGLAARRRNARKS